MVIEKALANKLPKLINTPADRRILMLERQHMNLYPARILAEIRKRAATFPEFANSGTSGANLTVLITRTS